MIKTVALALAIACSSIGAPQDKSASKTEEPVLISVSSKGSDVRNVLTDMFKQAGKSVMLEPNIRFMLYLSLEKVEFEEALRLICKTAALTIDVQNGIYFINKSKAPAAPLTKEPVPAVKGSFEAKPPIKGKLPEAVLNKKLTTRFTKIDIRLLMANLTQQTGVQFEIEADVPAFKLDAFLISTSLKYALDTICGATKLKYTFTDNMTIAISKPEPENRVTVVSGGL